VTPMDFRTDSARPRVANARATSSAANVVLSFQEDAIGIRLRDPRRRVAINSFARSCANSFST
jgi:hypothetical protein